jgi:integrase
MKTNKTAVTGIILETRKNNGKGLHPVKLRITFGKDRKYYTLKGLDKKSLYMTSVDFDKIQTSIKLKPLKIHLTEIEKSAMNVIKELNIFSFDSFETKYFAKLKDNDDLFSIMSATSKEFREAGKISTAVTYECALNSLKEFTGKEKFSFSLLTVKFLKSYEKWMLTPRAIEGKETSKVNSRTTVSIYLRTVRTIFNKVKPIGIIYPFGKSKNGLYAVPKGRNTKKALSQSDVAQIAAYKAARGTIEQRSRDYWLFSYLCNGINMKDVARLKYSNIDGNKIKLVRAKTADTVEEQTIIDIPITRPIRRIIDCWGIKPELPDQYIFDILKAEMTPEAEYKAIRQTVQTTNKNMEKVCKALGIERATTYTARHSFATVLKRSGASIEFISESLGHKSKQTTMNYLANFEDKEKEKWANMLLPKRKVKNKNVQE